MSSLSIRSEDVDGEEDNYLLDDNAKAKGVKSALAGRSKTCVSIAVGGVLIGVVLLSLIAYAATRELLSPTVISVDALANWSARAAPPIRWLAGDGLYATYNDSAWLRADGSLLLRAADSAGAAFSVSSSPFYALVPRDSQALFRHSVRAEFDLYDTATQGKLRHAFSDQLLRNVVFDQSGTTADFAVVDDNLDIHVVSAAANFSLATRVTADGGANITNGVQNWLYEEEIYGDANAIRFRFRYVAYLRSDETLVPLRTLPLYTTDRTAPDHWREHYSMVGDNIPVVSLRVFDRQANASVVCQTGSLPYVASFDFVDALDGDLFVQTLSRKQDQLEAYRCKMDGTCALLYSRHAIMLTWIDLMPVLWHGDAAYQIEQLSGERVVTKRTVGAIAMPVDLKLAYVPVALVGFDAAGFLWYTCAFPDPASQRVCVADGKSNPMLQADAATLTFSLGAASYAPLVTSATLSPNGSVALVRYAGPDVPFSAIVKTAPFGQSAVLEDNAALRALAAKSSLVTKTFFNVSIGEDLDTSAWIINEAAARNGIILNVYGGPDSVFVSHAWSVNINTVIASQLNVAVVGADVGGAGLRGVRFLRRNEGLGNTAAADSNAIMSALKTKYRARVVGIHGWSFGGHVASKCLTLDDKPDFAIAVAPVTDWRLYDAAYTERYTATDPAAVIFNATSVLGSACQKIPNNALLLMHGTNDDNVHYVNTAALATCLTQAGVSFAMHSFINKNHGISGDGARQAVYAMMLQFIQSKLTQ